MMTELAESRRAQRTAQARFESLLYDVQIGVLLQDGEGRITAANEVAAELLGVPLESLRGRGCDEWSLLGEPDRDRPTCASSTPCRTDPQEKLDVELFLSAARAQ